MVTYTIQSKLDPSGITSGKNKAKQDLRDLDNTAKTTASSMQRAFASGSLERQVMGLSTQVKALRGEVAGLGSANATLAQSNARLSGSLDQVAASLAREGAAKSSSAAAGTRKAASDSQLEASMRRVLAVADEEALELMKLNQLMEEASALYQRGAITAEQYARVQSMVAAGARQEGASLGQRRAGYQQLGFQIQDISMQAALGISPLTILAQQAGQTASAVVLMTGKVTGFWAFMAGPWGSVIIAAVAVLGSLAAAFFGSSHAADEDTEATRHNLTATDALGQAKGALGDMFDLTTGKVRNNTEAVRLNTLAVALNLRAQAELQIMASRGQLGVGRVLGSMMDRLGDNSLFAVIARGPSGQAAGENQDTLLRYNIVPGRPTDPGNREAAMTELANRALDLRRQAARETSNSRRAQLTNAAENTERLMNAINNEQQGMASSQTAQDMMRDVTTGHLSSGFMNPHRGGGGRHADPVGDFFERLTQQRDIAGMPQGLSRRIMDANQDFTRAANRPPSDDESARIDALVRETEARETLLHLTQTYSDAAEREYQLLGEMGVRRQQHNAILEEQARLGRNLDAVEEAVVREGVANLDMYRRMQAAYEDLDGGLQEYSDSMRAYLALLQQGKITQNEFNILVGQSPFQRQVDDMAAAMGGAEAYEAQMRQINVTIARYIELINQRARLSPSDPNHLSAEDAQRMRDQVQGPQGADGEIVVGGRSLRDRMVARVNRQNRADLGQWDQELGGNFDYQAQVQQENDHFQERLDRLREFREQGLITQQEYDAREQAEHERHNMKLAEMDRARYQTALHAASQGFGDLAEAIKGFAGEQSRVYRAMFIVSKAFAIAEAILGMQTAIAQAMKLPFPANIPAIAQAVSLGASVIANVQAITAQFKEGGYTGEGNPNDLAGMVHKKEFVMPEAATRRNRAVLEAMKAGATYGGGGSGAVAGAPNGGAPVVNIHNYGGSDVEVRRGLSPGEIDVMIDEKLKKDGPRIIAGDMADPNGRTSKALTRTYGVKRDRP